MNELRARLKEDPKTSDPPLDIPEYFWEAKAPSMEILLGMLKKEYGGVEKYLLEMGMPAKLPKQLQTILLT